MLHHPISVIITTSADTLGPSLCIRHCYELLTHTLPCLTLTTTLYEGERGE